MKPSEFCDEFYVSDLRILSECLKVTAGCHHVYNLAADMGGMGFIVSNQSVLLYNNTMISFNMLEASRQNGVKRYFYSSTACVVIYCNFIYFLLHIYMIKFYFI